jgi:hypothetical protein
VRPIPAGVPARTLRVAITALLLLIAPFASRVHAEEPAAPPQASPGPQGELSESHLFGDIPSVYSASKYEHKFSEAPSAVSIVTAEEIQKFGYRTLEDILSGLQGVFTTNDRNYNYVAFRGFGRASDYNSRVLRGPASSLGSRLSLFEKRSKLGEPPGLLFGERVLIQAVIAHQRLALDQGEGVPRERLARRQTDRRVSCSTMKRSRMADATTSWTRPARSVGKTAMCLASSSSVLAVARSGLPAARTSSAGSAAIQRSTFVRSRDQRSRRRVKRWSTGIGRW